MTMQYSDLIKEYRRLVAIHPDQLISPEVPERVVTVFETDRIRILLIRTPEAPDTVKMEIEVALPDPIWGLDAKNFSDDHSLPDQPAIKMSLEEMILLFQYLLQLQKAGFILDFFGDEGVWLACYYMKQESTKEFFFAFSAPLYQIKLTFGLVTLNASHHNLAPPIPFEESHHIFRFIKNFSTRL